LPPEVRNERATGHPEHLHFIESEEWRNGTPAGKLASHSCRLGGSIDRVLSFAPVQTNQQVARNEPWWPIEHALTQGGNRSG